MKNYSALLLILVAIGVFFFFVDPQYKEVKELRVRQAENDKMLEKAKELRAKRDDLNQRYKNISEEERTQLTKAVPETVDNVQLIFDIDNIARKYGIVLRGISVSGGTEKDAAKPASKQVVDKTGQKNGVITLGFSFSSSYDSFKSFLSDLEESLRLVDVTDFSVTANDANNIYDYSIKLNTYWLR